MKKKSRELWLSTGKKEFDEDELTEQASEPASDDNTSPPEGPKKTKEVKR
jgi:hypothetical protein